MFMTPSPYLLLPLPLTPPAVYGHVCKKQVFLRLRIVLFLFLGYLSARYKIYNLFIDFDLPVQCKMNCTSCFHCRRNLLPSFQESFLSPSRAKTTLKMDPSSSPYSDPNPGTGAVNTLHGFHRSNIVLYFLFRDHILFVQCRMYINAIAKMHCFTLFYIIYILLCLDLYHRLVQGCGSGMIYSGSEFFIFGLWIRIRIRLGGRVGESLSCW